MRMQPMSNCLDFASTIAPVVPPSVFNYCKWHSFSDLFDVFSSRYQSELQEEDINVQTSREASIDPADQSPRHKSGRLPIVNSSQVRKPFPLLEVGINVSYSPFWGTNNQEKASDVKDNNSSLTQPFFVHLTETERINVSLDLTDCPLELFWVLTIVFFST